MRTILTVLFVFFYLLLGSIYLGIEWILGKFNKKASDLRQLRFVQWAFKVVLFLGGVKLKVKGQENVPKGEAVLYIGNHRSIFDIVSTYSLCPGLTGYISKDNVKKVPILPLFMTRLHCLFLNREDVKQGLKTVLTAIDKVKGGISICVFPEGTRNKDREHLADVQPFKEGTFKIAQKSGCRIIPMAILGSAEIFENHFPWIRKGTITIVYGKPIVPSELDKDAQKKLGEHCRQVILGMLQKELAGNE